MIVREVSALMWNSSSLEWTTKGNAPCVKSQENTMRWCGDAMLQ